MTTPQPNLPVIPTYIVVHLGRPNAPAENVRVPFTSYIKNVASSEIYPTWPEASLRANIYAQITFALNRIYTEWYRSQGYEFDITNSTQFDQAFTPGRDIFENISDIVDDIFDDYVVKQGSVEPYFTQFCNGTTTTCDGLSQWGTVSLADQGYTPYAILQYYYGDDINIQQNAPVQDIDESYPGYPLQLGSGGNDVRSVQRSLNRIRRNFPAIPLIPREDGVFDVETREAVRTFQSIFNMPNTGIVDKSTWYRIKRTFNAVKKLSELQSEGLRLEDVTPIYPNQLGPGDTGTTVAAIQYYLNVFTYFNQTLLPVQIDGVFGEGTEQAVKVFQQQYGLPVTGVVYRETWIKMLEVYDGILSSLNTGYEGESAPFYPGYVLSQGMEGEDIKVLQRLLVAISKSDPEIPMTEITGYFGSRTDAAVRAFQRKYDLPDTGRVGAPTWDRLAQAYESRPAETI